MVSRTLHVSGPANYSNGLMHAGIVALKYNRGVGGANRRLLWLSDDSTTLKWVDEKRLAKLNRKSDKGGTPKRDREATKLPLQSVVDVEYGYGRCAPPRVLARLHYTRGSELNCSLPLVVKTTERPQRCISELQETWLSCGSMGVLHHFHQRPHI